MQEHGLQAITCPKPTNMLQVTRENQIMIKVIQNEDYQEETITFKDPISQTKDKESVQLVLQGWSPRNGSGNRSLAQGSELEQTVREESRVGLAGFGPYRVTLSTFSN